MRVSAVWMGSVLAIAGCMAGGPIDGSGSHTADLGSDSPISVEDQGSWYEYSCGQTCWRKQSFWIDLDVRNDAYDKTVAVVWTRDRWKTQQTAYARYEGDLGGGHEQWGVDALIGYDSGPYDRTDVEYAAYVVMNGTTSWDPENNHDLFGDVSRANPVELLDSSVGYDAATGAFLTGTVRVYNLAYEKQVSILYTTDDWATSAWAEASWSHDNDWTFRIAGLGKDVLPDDIRFAIRYRVAGQEHWDNNNTYDYVHRLAPQIYASGPYSYDEEPVSGIFDVYGYAYSDIPLDRIDLRVDDDAWTLGDHGLTSRQLERSTLGLADGTHQVEVRAVLEGGYQASLTQTFEVENRITPLGAWQPDFGDLVPPGSQDAGWSSGLASDAAGQIYVQWDAPWVSDQLPFRGVTRFAAFGTDVAPVAYARVPDAQGYGNADVGRLAVDDQGRTYGVETWPAAIWRWTADGEIDPTFGDGGQLDFSTDFDGHYLDGIGDLAAGGGALWVVGSCPSFVTTCSKLVARFDDGGALTGVVEIPADPDAPYGDYAQPVATWADGALWVQTQGKLLEIGDAPDGALAVLASVTLDGHVHPPLRDLVRTDDTFFGLDNSGRLVAFGDDGARLGAWSLYSQQLLPGGARDPIQLAVLADGDVAVLDGEGARLVVFDATLAPIPQ